MDAVLRGVFIYFFLMLLFRAAGKRSLSQIDTFDFVLLLIISEAVQNALAGTNHSMTFALILVVTLVGCEILMANIKQAYPKLESWVHGGPIIIVENGKPKQDLMHKSKIDEDEVLSEARLKHGLERMDQIKFAVLENNGNISIIPNPEKDKAA